MQFENSRFQSLRLTDSIGKKTKSIETLCFLHGLFQVKLSLLESTHCHTRLCCFGDPSRCVGHILDAVQLWLIPQHFAKVVLLRFR